MNEEGIGLVLARASELRSKLTNSIQKASIQLKQDERETKAIENDDVAQEKEEEEEEEEEEERLLSIGDAMESLEAQLSSLQALQHQQWYERESALAEIDHIRKKLLKQLKDYKGKDFEIIHEISSFASETVEENNDNRYLSIRKNPQNRVIISETKKTQKRGLLFFVNVAAKTVLTLVGVVSILGLAGFEPRLRKMSKELKIVSLFRQRQEEGEKKKVYVKERVEIPFGSVVARPDISYGCG